MTQYYLTILAFVGLGAGSFQIPDEVFGDAKLYFQTRWVHQMKANPQFYGLDPEIRFEDAILGDPFVHLSLTPEEVERFKESGAADPRGFAGRQLYLFPIFVEERFLGCIGIKPNSDRHGEAPGESEGEFKFCCLTSFGNPIDTLAIKFQKTLADPDGEPVAVVFMEKDGTWLIYRDLLGRLTSEELWPERKWR